MNLCVRWNKPTIALLVFLSAVIAGAGVVIVRHVQGNSLQSAALKAYATPRACRNV